MSRGGEKSAAGGATDAQLPWPALAIEMRELRQIRLNEENPRAHSLEQIELISDSMQEFGWTVPMLVDEDNVLLAGHGRLRAAKLKGWREGPVIVARGWTEQQKRAYLVMDNQLAARSDWDKVALRSTLRSLQAADFDMKLIGFTSEDLNKLVLEPATLESAEPAEVIMKRCPTCGHLTRKLQNE
jgi:ParB-like chromosome segregation protein Spo0J